jgi:hypothetical protein
MLHFLPQDKSGRLLGLASEVERVLNGLLSSIKAKVETDDD